MKKLFIPLLVILVLTPTEKAFSLFGIGVYGLKDNYTVSSYEENFNFNGLDLVGMTRSEMTSPIGIGAFLYIDAIPFIDIEANFEIAGQTYDFTWDVAGKKDSYEVAWVRSATYLTARKKIFGFGVPVLGGIKIHAGGGLNFQASVPLVNKEFMEGLLETADAEIDVNDIIDQAKKNKGVHLQAGAQIKVLALNLFVNGRYTIVKDVIPDKNGYMNIWLGLAFGL